MEENVNNAKMYNRSEMVSFANFVLRNRRDFNKVSHAEFQNWLETYEDESAILEIEE